MQSVQLLLNCAWYCQYLHASIIWYGDSDKKGSRFQKHFTNLLCKLLIFFEFSQIANCHRNLMLAHRAVHCTENRNSVGANRFMQDDCTHFHPVMNGEISLTRSVFIIRLSINLFLRIPFLQKNTFFFWCWLVVIDRTISISFYLHTTLSLGVLI